MSATVGVAMRSSEGASSFGKKRFRRVGKVCLADLSGVNGVKVCSVMQWAGTSRPCERPTTSSSGQLKWRVFPRRSHLNTIMPPKKTPASSISGCYASRFLSLHYRHSNRAGIREVWLVIRAASPLAEAPSQARKCRSKKPFTKTGPGYCKGRTHSNIIKV